MSKFRITPIGTCRIHNTVRPASGKYPIQFYVPRSYGFTHTSAEAIQQLDFLEGDKTFPAHLTPAIFRNLPDVDYPAQEWTGADLIIVEISSLKLITAGDYQLQGRYMGVHLADFFGSPTRTKSFWTFAERNPEQLQSFLEADPVFQQLPESDQRLLRETRMAQQSYDQLFADMTVLAERIGKHKLLFFTHINAADGKGRILPNRDRLIRWVERAAAELGVNCVNPTHLMLEFGQERALEREGLDTTHFTAAFHNLLYAHVHSRYIAPLVQRVTGASGEANEAAQMQMLADTISATLTHVDVVSGARQLHEALRANPGAPALIELRAQLNETLGDYHAALQDFRSPALQDTVLSSTVREARMRVHLALGQPEATLEVADELLNEEHESAELHETAAKAAEQLGQESRAIVHWKQLSRLKRDNIHAALRVLDAVAQQDDEAAQEWRAEILYFAELDEKLAEAIAKHGLAKGDIPLFRDAISALAGTSAAAAGELLLLVRDESVLRAAGEAVGRVLTAHDLPSRILRPLREIGRGWAAESIKLMEEGRFEEAAILSRASGAALEDDHHAVRSKKALSTNLTSKLRELAAAEDHDGVLRLIEGHEELVPSTPRVIVTYMRALQGSGREQAAIDVAATVAGRFPDGEQALVASARLLRRGQDISLAVRAYERVAEIDRKGRYKDEISRFWESAPRVAVKLLREALKNGDFQAAIRSLEVIEHPRGNAELGQRERLRVIKSMRIALRDLDYEDQEQRLDLMEQLAEQVPDDATLLRRAASVAMEQKQFARAVSFWERLNALSPETELVQRQLNRCRTLADRAALREAALAS